ncbi:MAG: 4Fe-4S dicluster domain-containing protein [Oligoflexia bacterium]|nr:4Fe-4S dicluster domain-containing protein [Oligoflexia bacterium]
MINRHEALLKIARAGVIGAGGGGFPAYGKFLACTKIDTVIANGLECEPLLWCDKVLMRRMPSAIINGLELSMKLAGASEGVVALKRDYAEIAKGLQAVIDEREESGYYHLKFRVRLYLSDNFYPAGDELILVHEVTGKVVAEGALPLSVGVLVHNVLSLQQMENAIADVPVVSRLVSVVGEVEENKVFLAPLGVSLQELLRLVRLKRPLEELRVIEGGPMMGRLLSKSEVESFAVGKRTSGILLLPQQHPVVRSKEMSVQEVIKRSKAVCCQCYRCSDLCPRSLLGHAIFPHQTMRSVDYGLSEPTSAITSAFLCSQCGICDLYACDVMELSPRKIFSEYRKMLQQAGVKNPHKSESKKDLSRQEMLKLPMSALLRKTRLSEYVHKDALFETIYPSSVESQVAINIGEHIGERAQVVVKVGDQVSVGEMIAISPGLASGVVEKLGSSYHASMNGIVSEATSERVVIIKGEAYV